MYWTDYKEKNKEKMILLCGFGTSDAKELEGTYGKLLETARNAFPGQSVRLALTSSKVLERLYSKNGIMIPDVRTAMEEAAEGGIIQIRILPVQVAGGSEYEKLREISGSFGEKGIKVILDSPLLAGPGAEALADLLAEKDIPEGEAVLYVGHGSHGRDPGVPEVYQRLQELIRKKGKSNIFIGELQTGPDRLLKELSFSSARMIRLRPLMMVSGHHWNKDVAGEKTGSWRNVLLEAGYEVICEKEGLLRKDEIIDLLLGQKGLS